MESRCLIHVCEGLKDFHEPCLVSLERHTSQGSCKHVSMSLHLQVSSCRMCVIGMCQTFCVFWLRLPCIMSDSRNTVTEESQYQVRTNSLLQHVFHSCMNLRWFFFFISQPLHLLLVTATTIYCADITYWILYEGTVQNCWAVSTYIQVSQVSNVRSLNQKRYVWKQYSNHPETSCYSLK